jgi:prophage regulatory protein
MTTSETLRREGERKRVRRDERQSRRVLRLPEVKTKTGKSRSEIYDGMKDGTFPGSIPIGERAVGWLEEEIDAWIDACAAKRDAARRAATTRG